MVRRAPDPRRRRDLAGGADELPDLSDPRAARRQVNTYVALDDYLLLRAEAARRGVSRSALIAEWIAPRIAELRDAAKRDAA